MYFVQLYYYIKVISVLDETINTISAKNLEIDPTPQKVIKKIIWVSSLSFHVYYKIIKSLLYVSISFCFIFNFHSGT